MAGLLRIKRRHGAFLGLLLMLLGAWGALIALIGPYFHYAYTPDSPWTYTTGRLDLEILPGIAALAGGLLVLMSSLRPVAMLGAGVAAISGIWFAIGSDLAPIWMRGSAAQGAPVGSTVARAVEHIGFFTGLGAALVLLAALAIGRLTVLAPASVRDPVQRTKTPTAELPTAPTPPAAHRQFGTAMLRRVVPGSRPPAKSETDVTTEQARPAGVRS